MYDRFLRCFPRAAKRARAELVRAGALGKDAIVIACDEAGDLVPLSLTRSQLLRHFPQYDEAEQERQRITALSEAEQIAELLPYAVRSAPTPGILVGEYTELMRRIGAPAVPALVDVVNRTAPGEPISAVMLLAEINHESPAVIVSLERAMLDDQEDHNTRAWAAAALSRLGHMNVVVEHAALLPIDVVARGLTAPYRSFRDRGEHRPLDYRPLEAAMRTHPHLVSAVAEELSPGRGFCALDPEEVPVARSGLDSELEVVRVHARTVLESIEGRQ